MIPPTLEDLALNFIVYNILDFIPEINTLLSSELQDLVFDVLEEDIPLSYAVQIENQLYWQKKLVNSKLPMNVVIGAPKTNSKRYYIEHQLTYLLENAISDDQRPSPSFFDRDLVIPQFSELLSTMKYAGTFVRKLSLSQIGSRELSVDQLLNYLPNLEDLRLCLSSYYIRSDFLLDIDPGSKASGISLTDEVCRSLGFGLSKLSLLVSFEISDSSISDQLLLHLLPSFQSLPALRHVSLAHNKLGKILTPNCPIFLHSINPFLSLESIDFSNNFINDHYSKQIAQLIINSKVLKNLNLLLNQISDKGAIYILAASTQSNSLTFLSLSSNRLCGKSFEFLTSIMESHQLEPLEVLDLSNNDFKASDLGLLRSRKLQKEVKTKFDLRGCGFETHYV
ncbi:hypothetical protein P9112_002070 [Eukaryota sp. TZLM1-RC]